MHIIISEAENGRKGNKANNLIRLDKLGLTPNFVVLDDSVFLEHIEEMARNEGQGKRDVISYTGKNQLEKFICKKSINSKVLAKLYGAMKSLGINNPIVRSSCTEEDSITNSFAGLFESFVCSKDEVEASVKKVWLSLLSKKVEEYSKARFQKSKPRFTMGVIIQEFIRPGFGGVIFLGEKGKKILIEFAKGSSDSVELGKDLPYCIYAESDGFANNILPQHAYFYSSPDILKMDWLGRLSTTLEKLSILGFDEADIEFVVDDDGVKIVQIRNLSHFPPPDGLFVLNTTPMAGFSADDISLEKVSLFFDRFNIRCRLKVISIEGNYLLADYDFLAGLYLSIRQAAKDSTHVKNIYDRILSYHRAKISKLQALDDPIQMIVELKNYNINIYFCDLLVNLLIKSIKDSLMQKGIDERSHPEYFRPHKMTLTSKNLLSALDKKEPLFLNNLADEGLLDVLTIDETKYLIETLEKNYLQPNLPGPIKAFQSMIWLHDANNYFMESVASNIENKFRTLTAQKIDPFLLLGFKEILGNDLENLKMLCVSHEKNGKPIKPKLKKPSFPLKGRIASYGNFEGKVRVVDFMKGVFDFKKGEVIVAYETSPKLVMAMAICSGIITEMGGLTSHAAIVSRELGKPCVVGVKGCTEALRTGDHIIVKEGYIEKKKT